jgi:hypothetical protein
MWVDATEEPYLDRGHSLTKTDFQRWEILSRVDLLLDLIGDMTQLAKSALWVGRVWLFMIEEMRWRAVGVHDKYKALGISVVVQFLERRWQNISDDRPRWRNPVWLTVSVVLPRIASVRMVSAVWSAGDSAK